METSSTKAEPVFQGQCLSGLELKEKEAAVPCICAGEVAPWWYGWCSHRKGFVL